MTPEVNRVYLGSFWPQYKTPLPNRFEENRDLIAQEQRDLLRDLRSIPKNAALRRVNEIVKRARQARVHAHIIGHLRSELPAMFGKNKKAKEMLEDLPGEFRKIQVRYNLPPGDFPNPEAFKRDLEAFKIADFNKLNQKLISSADDALAVDFPRLMQKFPTDTRRSLDIAPEESNGATPALEPTPPPYSAMATSSSSRNPFGAGDNPAALRYLSMFVRESDPKRKMVDGSRAGRVLADSGLDREVLRCVWEIADWDARGELDQVQFEVAMRLCERIKNGENVEAAKPAVLAELGLGNRFF
ncbi:hypothetical protein FBU59_003279 [Linderina macrospora]|uniref:Uncharacterized protein n=1 Tax=Linderina macrospora TaxID=4868 RepID=A0ACC1J8S3_9FUNG|nr:hypothetical protein FBU59_003279 [Linderina macrospora]